MKHKKKHIKLKPKKQSQFLSRKMVNKFEILDEQKKEKGESKLYMISQKNSEITQLKSQMNKSDLEPIGLINLSLEKSINIQRIKSWIEIYLGLEVQILNLQLALYYENNDFYIIDLDRNENYKLKKDNKDIINVISIFEVMRQVKPSNISSLIAIVDQDIYDPFQPEANIVGRAGNKKVCVVQVQTEVDDFYSTIVHELLHTLGFGHCNYQFCLMYANISTSMQLCQKHLKQLSHLKEIEELKRYKELLEISRTIGLNNECKILEKLIENFETPSIPTEKLLISLQQ